MIRHLPPQPLPPINYIGPPHRPETGDHARIAVLAILFLCSLGVWIVVLNIMLEGRV